MSGAKVSRNRVGLTRAALGCTTPASSQVDALLMENSEAAAKLKFRLFLETYAIHWAEEKAH